MRKLRPIVCTLTDTEREARGGRWRNLVRGAGGRVEPTANGVTIALDGSVNRDEIEELIELERACCSWMRLHLERRDGDWALEIAADSGEGAEVIRSMTGLL
jgi:hypothetical protein